MLQSNLDLSVTICTLDEEKNIKECLLAVFAQKPSEVIVVDGGSVDNTISIAKDLGAMVINAGRKGLAYQRKIGVDRAEYKFIALIDADQRPTVGCFASLIKEIEKYQYDGIGAQRVSVRNIGYWDWAMEKNFKLTHNNPGPRIMIGTPCIYRSSVLKIVNFDPFFTGPSDDTDLCYRMVSAGYKLGMGTGEVKEENRSEFKTFRKKWIWYGKGDAQFVWKHRERLLSIVKHEVYNYPIKKSWIAIQRKEFKVIPFFILCGIFRHYGFLKEMIKMILGKRIDHEIYST